MNPLTRYIVVSFLFATAGLLALPANAQDIVVGELASLTGSEATFGINSSNGVELAKEEINNAGGLLGGRKIKIIMEDDQSKPGQPSAAVKKLVASDRAIAILGEIASSRSLEAAPICQNAKIPMVSPGSTNPSVTEKGDYIFRVCFIDPFQGTVMAKFALDNLHKKKIAILQDVKSDYSKGLPVFQGILYEPRRTNCGRLILHRRRHRQGFSRTAHQNQSGAAGRNFRSRLLH